MAVRKNIGRFFQNRFSRITVAAAVAVAMVVSVSTFAAEPPQTVTGELQVRHVDNFKTREVRYDYALRTPNGSIQQLDTNGEQLDLDPGTKITVTGKKRNDVLKVDTEESPDALSHNSLVPAAVAKGDDRAKQDKAKKQSKAKTEKASQAQKSKNSGKDKKKKHGKRKKLKKLAEMKSADPKTRPAGELKVAVILFNFKNDRSQPISAYDVRRILFTGARSVNALYREQSFNKLGFRGKLRSDGDVYGTYTVNQAKPTCDSYNIFNMSEDAKRQASQSGAKLEGYDHIVYVFPQLAGECSWAGQGTLAGPESWINGNSARDGSIYAHELGHNLGLNHASSYRCRNAQGTAVAVSGSCSADEYGDPYDVMGYSGQYHHTNNGNKSWMQWILPSSVKTVTQPGTYQLAPIESGTTVTQAIRIPRRKGAQAKPLDYYYLEYRRKKGFDNFSDPITTDGVLIRVVEASPYKNTLLIDTTPNSDQDFNGYYDFHDAPLATGKKFTDQTNKVSIKVLSSGERGASLQISLTSQPEPPQPTPTPPVPDDSGLLYRLYNPQNGHHLYTIDTGEVQGLLGVGYIQEPTIGKVSATPRPGYVELFRLFHPRIGDHLYTTNAAERDSVQRLGYVYEGNAGYIVPDASNCPANGLPLYRLWSVARSDHFYTADTTERDAVIRNYGYVLEGTTGCIGRL